MPVFRKEHGHTAEGQENNRRALDPEILAFLDDYEKQVYFSRVILKIIKNQSKKKKKIRLRIKIIYL